MVCTKEMKPAKQNYFISLLLFFYSVAEFEKHTFSLSPSEAYMRDVFSSIAIVMYICMYHLFEAHFLSSVSYCCVMANEMKWNGLFSSSADILAYGWVLSLVNISSFLGHIRNTVQISVQFFCKELSEWYVCYVCVCC